VKRKNFLWILPVFIALYSCNTSNETKQTVIKGSVYYMDSQKIARPVAKALVTAKSFYVQAQTDANGAYGLSIEPTEDEAEVTIQVSKVGFSAAEEKVMVKKDKTVRAPDITLIKTTSDSSVSPTDTMSTSNAATHIELSGEADSHIYIRGSGLKEYALINFLVTDDQGVAVDQDHKITVHFSILNGPNGGEYVYPAEMETANGKAYTILNSGTVAGPVQIQASAEVDTATIRTLPIRLAIYGGLPDENHFSIALQKVNIAGQVHSGIIDQITAFIGDKYSNPVAPGTVVYFSTDYGIVEGAGQTDAMGRATARFMSAYPLPPDPLTNPFAHISAFTYTDTLASKQISTSRNLLLSGPTAAVTVTPSSFTYDNTNKATNFIYTVSDVWGYPLVGGTAIQVDATDGTLYGDVGINLQDTQASGQGSTQFSFSWAPGDSLEAAQVYISIKVNTPEYGNGYRSLTISGMKTQ